LQISVFGVLNVHNNTAGVETTSDAAKKHDQRHRVTCSHAISGQVTARDPVVVIDLQCSSDQPMLKGHLF
jgi:hypothetical protein